MTTNPSSRPVPVAFVRAASLLAALCWSWASSPQPSAQLLPPLPGSLVVTITSPSSGATVAGTITVSASVSPVGALVGGVQFKLDGANLGGEDTTAPYSVSWNTTAVANGTHTLRAVARDAIGLQFVSDPVNVTVSNAPPPDTTRPTVNVTSPGSGATVSGTVTISATASDNVGVAGVQFYVDGSARGSEDTAAPYSVSWNTTTASNGSHTLTAVARDAAGNRTTSAPVSVTVSNAPPPDTTPPNVSINSPAGGATVSGTVTISAAASDNVGVSIVQFLMDGAELGRDTTAPYSVSWNTTTTSNGSHTLQARAQDAAGNIGDSAPVTVTVSNAAPSDTTPPNVSITSPAGGATVSGSVTISASASDNVGVAGVQFLVDGAARGPEDTAAPYSVPWDTTTASNGSHTLTAVARDAAGNRTTSAPVAVTVSNTAPPGTARFEETAAMLAPVGAWSELSNSGAGATLSGGRGVFSSAAGATATFNFDGTGVAWIGLPCEICGIAEVLLDGALAGTVDTFAPGRPASSGPMFTASGLASGSHTLVIRITAGRNPSSGGTHVVVDAYDVEGGTTGGGGGATRVEETDPSVTYTGTWIPQSDASVSGGSVVESPDAGATASLTFDGTGVSWIGFKADFGGIAEVYLDGTLVATVDTYAPTWQPQTVMYSASGLSVGSHTIMVRVTGTWNPAGRSSWIVVDAFDVM